MELLAETCNSVIEPFGFTVVSNTLHQDISNIDLGRVIHIVYYLLIVLRILDRSGMAY